MDIFAVLNLMGGLILFLYGMDLMGDGLKKLAGGRLETILGKLTSAKWKGLLLGLTVTAVIQSSSATTVMLVGFVNSGIMKLGQTISIIMGANVGTTVTSWLLSTADISGTAIFMKLLKPESFTPILAVIGFLMITTGKTDRRKSTGTIFIGFAILMFGMSAMSSAVSGLRENETFISILTMFSNPFMGILVGTLFTAIIQSSSASVGILQALSLSCFIPYSSAIPIILGQNIGTTITPIISSISGNADSKRVAFTCLAIKMVGVIVVAGGFYLLNGFLQFEFMSSSVSALSIAFIHTIFNIISTVILIPFSSLFEKLAIKFIKSKKEEQEADIFATLDERFLTMPSFAVEKCRELVYQMADVALDSYVLANNLLDNYTSEGFETVEMLESKVDKYEDKTSAYLVKIASKQMSAKDSKVVTELLHCVGDLERISDHALNIAEAAKEVYDKQITFSEKAKEDIGIIGRAVSEILEHSVSAFLSDDVEKANLVEPLEQVVDTLKRKIKTGHIARLRQGECTIEMGFVLSDLVTNYERISDHCSNIALCVLEMAYGTFDTHEYTSNIKKDDTNEFNKNYEMYKEKYHIE